MSMYRGKARFTKEQVIFTAQVIISAGLGRIESCLPPGTPAKEFRDSQLTIQEWINGCRETVGMALATLYAQLSGDGLAIGDALELIGFEDVCSDFITARLKNKDAKLPDSRALAENFVNAAFGSVWFAE